MAAALGRSKFPTSPLYREPPSLIGREPFKALGCGWAPVPCHRSVRMKGLRSETRRRSGSAATVREASIRRGALGDGQLLLPRR